MDITVAESLGDKLAAMDLTDDEAALLRSILSVEVEVEGFAFDPVKTHFVPAVRARVGQHRGWGED